MSQYIKYEYENPWTNFYIVRIVAQSNRNGKFGVNATGEVFKSKVDGRMRYLKSSSGPAPAIDQHTFWVWGFNGALDNTNIEMNEAQFKIWKALVSRYNIMNGSRDLMITGEEGKRVYGKIWKAKPIDLPTRPAAVDTYILVSGAYITDTFKETEEGAAKRASLALETGAVTKTVTLMKIASKRTFSIVNKVVEV